MIRYWNGLSKLKLKLDLNPLLASKIDKSKRLPIYIVKVNIKMIKKLNIDFTIIGNLKPAIGFFFYFLL